MFSLIKVKQLILQMLITGLNYTPELNAQLLFGLKIHHLMQRHFGSFVVNIVTHLYYIRIAPIVDRFSSTCRTETKSRG
jgi:hypothetical protein